MDNEIFQVFEGICPTCNCECELTESHGTKEFHDDHPRDVPGDTWDRGVTERGEQKFACINGHITYVWNTFEGDWIS